MTRLAVLLAVPALLCALTAAADATPRGGHTAAARPPEAEILPVPPVPPDALPAYAPAPVPDADISAPPPHQPQHAEMEARLYHTKTQFRGDGFAPYSTAQVEQERNFRPAPGVALRVPLP